MRKLIILILILALSVSLIACAESEVEVADTPVLPSEAESSTVEETDVTAYADDDFIADLENLLKDLAANRELTGDLEDLLEDPDKSKYIGGTNAYFANELDVLGKYRARKFYDQRLYELAQMYFEGINTQMQSVRAEGAKVIYDKATAGAYLKYTALMELYDSYGLLKDDPDLLRENRPIQEEFLRTYPGYLAVNEDIDSQMDAVDIYSALDEKTGELLITLTNNTDFTYSADFSFHFLNEKLVWLDSSEFLPVRNLAPGESVELKTTVEGAEEFYYFEYDFVIQDVEGFDLRWRY